MKLNWILQMIFCLKVVIVLLYFYLSLVSELRKRFEGITTSASDSAMYRYEGGDLCSKWLGAFLMMVLLRKVNALM